MTLERKLLIAVGAFIIALIIAVGAFSLGLYVGQKGIFPDAPNIAGPGGGGPPGQPGPAGQQPRGESPGGGTGQAAPEGLAGSGNQPPQNNFKPSNLPAGPPDLVGTLRSMDTEGLTIDTPPGPRLVQLADNLEIFDPQGKSLTLDTLQPNTHLALFGHFTNNGQTMVAETVIILPQPGQRPGMTNDRRPTTNDQQ
ncbi:MAG: hypothetical protein JW953_03190 [Anaerolineae bacterium]|nr:hypothetical protein [Anaerolineae bacterium]